MENLDPLRQKPDRIGGDPFPDYNAVQHIKSIDAEKNYVRARSISIPKVDAILKKYEEDRDKFAIGFGVFVRLNENDLGEYKSTPDLLELYKEQLKTFGL